MLERLKSKWNVSGGRLLLIIVTFAVGGSLCGYAGRKILGLLNFDKGVLWVLLYIILITILWPLAVIVVSIFTGQFGFFRRYLQRIFRRMSGGKKTGPVNLAIFASGTGTNAGKIISELPGLLAGKKEVCIAVIITDNPNAGVLKIAAANKIPAEFISLKNKTAAETDEAYISLLKKYSIDFIVLAGYLKKIPSSLISLYPNKIVNIHPALLPAYGGKGMYGMRVHDAVIAAGEKQSGISIHFVDEIYDHGKIVFQSACDIDKDESAASLAEKIHALEHRYYPSKIAEILVSQNPR